MCLAFVSYLSGSKSTFELEVSKSILLLTGNQQHRENMGNIIPIIQVDDRTDDLRLIAVFGVLFVTYLLKQVETKK